MSLLEERSELIKSDTTSVADKFGWLEEVRQLNLSMLDAEERNETILNWFRDRQEGLLEEGTKQRTIVENWNHSRPDTPNRCFQYELNTLYMVRMKYKAIKDFIDKLEAELGSDLDNHFFAPPQDDPDDQPESVIPSHWQQAKAYWSNILDYISNNQMSYKTTKRLYHKVKKAKKQKSISSFFYFHIMFWCTSQLGYLSERNNILSYGAKCKQSSYKGSMWNPVPIPLENIPLSPSFDDQFYSDPSVDIEQTVDTMISVRKLALSSGCSLHETYYSLMDH